MTAARALFDDPAAPLSEEDPPGEAASGRPVPEVPPSSDPADRRATLERLRARVRRMEGGGAAGRAGAVALGVAAIDAALPGGGIARGCLHEIAAASAGEGDGIADDGIGQDGAVHDGAAIGFAALAAARFAEADPAGRPVLWLAQPVPGGRGAGADLYAPGLAAYGLTPDRLLVAAPTDETDRLWALEEAARSGALAAVVGEAAALDLTASRRLQLACESGGVPVLLLARPDARAARRATPPPGRGTPDLFDRADRRGQDQRGQNRSRQERKGAAGAGGPDGAPA
ncbi:MAG: hypothetical protein RID91_02700, partial [Azospirillaceae bacterium]